jgi:tetratricopeptide (TPR) repeat protein
MSARAVESAAAFYGDENKLAEKCGAFAATHVLYSIDVLLDDSPYSPRYLADFHGPLEESLAYRMHFAPETLKHFQLVYENDNYRLFRLTVAPEPVFLSDHPPVYQKEILRVDGNDLGAFYARVVDILTTFHTGVESQAKGDEEAAIRRFRYCLEQAPFFTRAWLGTGDSLLRLGRSEEAFAAYNRVLSYAPDDTHALYYGALSLAYTGKKDEALRLIELLFTATGDKEIRTQALELESALKSGRRIEPPPGPASKNPG